MIWLKMNQNQQKTDIVIIGAGPAGLFAVFQCGMLNMRCHVVDSLAEIGGQCSALYPEKPIYDIPSQLSLSAGELVEKLENQAAPFHPVYHLNQQVDHISETAEGFCVQTSKHTHINCKAVIIAAGAGAFGPNRPPLKDIESFESKSVFYMVRRRQDMADRKIVIAGGGDSAVDWAVSLADTARKIYVVHRRDKFRAAPESVLRMKKLANDGKIELVIPHQLHALHGTGGVLSAVEVADLDGNKKVLEADTLLPFFGLAPSLGPIAQWDLDVALHHIPVDPVTMQTKRPGVFAIGDVATYPRKLKLILTGFAEAATAAHAAYPLVFSGAQPHFEYSTSKGAP